MNKAFDQGFCSKLEYHLTRTFRNSEDKILRSLWCDGILVPQSRNQNNDEEFYLATKAWIGKTGQDEYEMRIKFGECSIRQYSEESDLTICLPNENSSNWILIDIEKKRIELQLN